MKFKKATKDLNLKSNERLYLKIRSPFAPKHYKDLKPNGFKIFTFNSGFKKKKDDLLIIVFDQAVNMACKYSLTTTPSAPIIWDKKNNKGSCRALIVNSGNANAHTGKQGLKNINMYVSHLAKFLECSKKEILVSSTGVIGEQIDPNLISKKIKLLSSSKEKNLIDASRSICTTDTFVKTAVHNVNLDNKNIKVYGFAKGSGMISPNMGTMLVYIFIDCEIAKDYLKKLLSENLEETFNSITVDSDTSTNDSSILISSGKTKTSYEKLSAKDKKKFYSNIESIYIKLAKKIIKDAEGATKFISINVKKIKNKNYGKNIGMSIANSPLVKTALFAEDPNWGRILSAIGNSKIEIRHIKKLEIYLGKYLIFKNNMLNKKYNENLAIEYLKKKNIEINIVLNNGNEEVTIWTSDLTYKYIKINAEYRS